MFYTNAPFVTVQLHRIVEALVARTEVYKQLKFRPGFFEVKDGHHVAAGKVLDVACHHLLRLCCLESRQFQEFFIESEVEIFRRRVSTVTDLNVRRILERVAQEAQMGNAVYHREYTLKELDLIKNTATLMLEHCTHAFARGHPRECETHTLCVHFTECLQLVRKRLVELDKGIAYVPCGLWRDLLTERFETFLRSSVEEARSHGNALDGLRVEERLWPLLRRVIRQFNGEVPRQTGALMRANLQEKSVFFPLCMKNALLMLTKRHRLSHEARRALTLFLKDAGMSVREAIALWCSEYSKVAHCESSCQHSWQEDYRRFRYSVRHMYGLEGSRIKYTSFSCNKVQDREGDMKFEVSCPFKEENLYKLEDNIPDEVKVVHSTLVEDLRAAQPLSSKGRCHLYQKTCHGCRAGKTFESPLGYYRCSLAESW